MKAARANVVSSFMIVKGAQINQTYEIFSAWDLALSKRQNLDRLRERNAIGAPTQTWLRDVAKVINRRFDPAGRDRPLVVLAQRGCPLEVWKPILLWHMTRDEFLLRDFLIHWLYPAREAGTFRIRPKHLFRYLRDIEKRGGVIEHVWSERTLERVAAGLLKMSVEFGLLRGSVVKEVAHYNLPEESFLYLLHAMRDEQGNPRKVIDAPDWRMYFMQAADVERELLRLHQFRKLEYEVAGSLVQLTLPCATSRDYADRLVA